MCAKIKWKTKKDKFPEVMRELELLQSRKIQVGVLEGEHQWLAAIHEYGCDIKAVNAQYLTVPISPKSRGKKAGDFEDLFVITSRQGQKFLARDKARGEIELLYWLTKSVKIPERSFLRAGYDYYINDVMKYADELLEQVAGGKMSSETFLDALGQQLASKIKRYARDLNRPKLSGATTETKGSSNPLADTGAMINGITWRVE